MRTFDVIVVGLGPVGELAALMLAREGLDVMVLERESDVYSEPRVGVLDGEALRTLQKAGVVDEVISAMLPGTGAQWVSKSGKVVATTMPTEQLQGHPWLTAIHQPTLDRYLRAAVIAAGVDVRLGHILVDLRGAETSVEVEYLDDRGQTGHAEARYVIGCDGANSGTRRALGVELKTSDFTDKWVIVDAHLPEPVARTPYFQMWLDPDAPRLIGRLAEGWYRWERRVMPGDDLDHLLSPEWARRMIAELTDPDAAVIARHLTYDFRATVAEHWRVGRVLLCGDAAHLMPPMIGQGLNSGIRDVTNLAWKVVAVVKDGAPVGLLDSYESERRPHAEFTMNMSVATGRIVTLESPGAAAIRDSIGSVVARLPIVSEHIRQGHWRRPARYRRGLLSGRTSPWSPVGRLFPQPTVRAFDGSLSRLDDAIGSGWRIVGWKVDPGEFLSHFGLHFVEGVMGATITTLTPVGKRPIHAGASTAILEDVEGLTARFFRWRPIVILRPDHYVYASVSPAGLESVLASLGRELTV